MELHLEWKMYLAFLGLSLSKVSKDRSKRRQMQDAVVNFIKTVLLSAVIKIVWSYSVVLLSFVSWRGCAQIIKSIFHFHLFSICTVLLYCFSWTVTFVYSRHRIVGTVLWDLKPDNSNIDLAHVCVVVSSLSMWSWEEIFLLDEDLCVCLKLYCFFFIPLDLWNNRKLIWGQWRICSEAKGYATVLFHHYSLNNASF